MIELIGKRYELGADGSGDAIDCIHLVYAVQAGLGIAMPPFDLSWYGAGWQRIIRDLLAWGRRVDAAEYDGDILLFKQERAAFAVAWQTGILYINPQTERVDWLTASSVKNYHCFRSSAN